jgi:hypothetical protein
MITRQAPISSRTSPRSSSRGRRRLLLIAFVLLAAWGPTEVPQTGRAENPEATRNVAKENAASLAKTMRLVNYYPSANPWQRTWTHWSPDIFDADMAQIAGLGATMVRLVLFPKVLGYPTPDPAMAGRLDSAISIAQRRGLTVQLTLFDSWEDYGDLQNSQHWTTALLSRYRDDARISFVEAQNEIDPSNPQAMSWARDQIRLLHHILPSTPVTISTAGRDGVAGMAALRQGLRSDPPDFYSLHYFGSAELAYDAFTRAAAAVAPAPLVIGEAGYSTGQDDASMTKEEHEAYQAFWYRIVDCAARAAGLSPVAPWILHDFPPTATTSKLPAAEYGFGLLRTDGTPKPAVAVLSQAFAGKLDPGPYNGNFSDQFDGGKGAAGWTPWMPSGLAHVALGAGVHGGNALVFSGTDVQTDGVTAWYTVPAEPVRPQATWTVTVYARGTQATGSNDVALAWFDAHGAWLGNTVSRPLQPSVGGWQKLVVSGTAPADARAVEIHLRSEGNDGEVAYSEANWTVNVR